MKTPRSSNARIAAVFALVAALIVILVLVVSSLGGGGSGNRGQRPNLGAAHGKRSRRKIYVVKPGDTLSLIAQKVGTSVDHLQQLNPKLDQFSLQSGDRVKLR